MQREQQPRLLVLGSDGILRDPKNHNNIVKNEERIKTKNVLPLKESTLKLQNKTIIKNKNCNTWYARYRENGAQHYISGRTQKEVYEKLKNKLNVQEKDTSKNITLIKWYQKWLEAFKIGVVKESTIVDYEKILKRIDESLLNSQMKNINAFDIIETLNKIKEERTKQKVYELLKALFEKAFNLNMIPHNVVKQIDKPKHRREEGVALTEKEQKVFIDYCNSCKYGDLFLITLYQGLRIGEALGLTGNDIDLDNNTLSISKAWTSVGWDSTKNDQSHRIMPIFKNTRSILEKYVNLQNTRLFNVSYWTPREYLVTACKETGIRQISAHDLRHTFITNCKNKNIPEHVIQAWVGHKIGSKVTANVYTHINVEDVSKYISQFEE